MKINLSQWTINQKLALVAFLLGLFGLFLDDPTKASIATVDINELSLKIQDKSTYVGVEELAGWIIQKKADYVLVDLREEAKYNEYFIPGAVNYMAGDILKANLPKTEKILLYSEDNSEAAQAWFLLKSKNYMAVYILEGGVNKWKELILFPTLPQNATAQQKAEFDKMSEISKFFGGSPRVEATDSTATVQQQPQVVMPKPSAPAAPAKQAGGGKAKREGC
jgi:rhodanese-related sulfurtransferase